MSSDFVRVPETLIPLSHLELDLEPSTAGWAADLAAKGVAIHLDDLGRASISRSDARRLIAEKRERLARHYQMEEQRFAKLEGERLARLPKGLPWYEVPAGMSAAEAMVAGWSCIRFPARGSHDASRPVGG